MCGIVGLFLKDAKLEPRLGHLVAPMLAAMSDRGPDSAGFALYGEGVAGSVKLTLRGTDATSFELDRRRAGAACWPSRLALAPRHPCGGDGPGGTRKCGTAKAEGDRAVACRDQQRPPHGAVQRGRLSGRRRRALWFCPNVGHACDRPYAHGDGIGGDHEGRASVFDRHGSVPRAQRLAVEPQ